MKKLLFSFLISYLFFADSCKNELKNEKQTEKKVLHKERKNIEDKNSLLMGTWAENINDNSLFYLDGLYLYYPESENGPINYYLKNDSLFIMGDPVVKCKILKLSKDSLWYTDNMSDDTTRLIKK